MHKFRIAGRERSLPCAEPTTWYQKSASITFPSVFKPRVAACSLVMPMQRCRVAEMSAGVVPSAFILAAILAMSAYPLTEAKFQEIVREVAQRRAARQEVVL